MDPTTILACPACKGELIAKARWLVCDQCREPYPSLGASWDLRSPRFRGHAEHGEWSLEEFSQAYESFGNYESSAEHSRRSGVPEAVEAYRYPRIKGRLLDWIAHAHRAGAILDVGCGVGQFLLEVGSRLEPAPRIYVGIDVVPVRVRYTQEKFAGREGFIALTASAEELPFADGQFDIVTCTEVMEHVASPEAAFAEIARVLRPGGLFCLSTPNRVATDLWETLFWLPGLLRRAVRGTLFQPTSRPYDRPIGPARLLKLFREAGFSILDFQRNVFLPHESYFHLLPDGVGRLAVAAGACLESRAPALSPYLGLHQVVRAMTPLAPGGPFRHPTVHHS